MGGRSGRRPRSPRVPERGGRLRPGALGLPGSGPHADPTLGTVMGGHGPDKGTPKPRPASQTQLQEESGAGLRLGAERGADRLEKARVGGPRPSGPRARHRPHVCWGAGSSATRPARPTGRRAARGRKEGARLHSPPVLAAREAAGPAAGHLGGGPLRTPGRRRVTEAAAATGDQGEAGGLGRAGMCHSRDWTSIYKLVNETLGTKYIM